MRDGRLVPCGKLAWLLIGVLGCSSHLPAVTPAPTAGVLSDGDVTAFQNALDAIAARRGNWLWGQPAMACRCEPVVYINGLKARGLGDLRTITPVPRIRITRLGPRDAAARFGAGHEAGAILVDFAGHPL